MATISFGMAATARLKRRDSIVGAPRYRPLSRPISGYGATPAIESPARAEPRFLKPSLGAGALAGAALLVSCAPRSALPSLAVGNTPPPAATRPVPPAGASAGLTIPKRGADGAYRTLNSDLSSAAAIWHVRSALNVAALGCRGIQENALIANYNMMLASKRAVLATAFAKTESEARKSFGKTAWRDGHDREMTQLYNFFAQPPAKERFCNVAASVAAEAAVIQPADFESFAGPALARLEAPFTDFYRAYDDYRRDLAAWDAGDRRAAALQPAAAQLAYASLKTIIAWVPDNASANRRLASADPVPGSLRP